jgi:hypothetical protein
MEDWYKNPTVLIVAGVAIFGAIILLRNQNSSGSSTSSSTSPQIADPLANPGSSATTPVGQSYTYLDGSGIQHIITTDPQGNLSNYASVQPQYTTAQQGQISSVVGSMSGIPLVNPYVMSGTPYYATFDPSQFLSQLSTYTNPSTTTQ